MGAQYTFMGKPKKLTFVDEIVSFYKNSKTTFLFLSILREKIADFKIHTFLEPMTS